MNQVHYFLNIYSFLHKIIKLIGRVLQSMGQRENREKMIIVFVAIMMVML